jgi:non-specific protein-tyrosine kinase
MSKLKRALERAKEARNLAGQNSSEKSVSEPAPKSKGQASESQRNIINPKYQSTRVLRIDPDFLRMNKVVANCIENKMADHIKILRAQILQTMNDLQGSVLLVTSAHEKEGKTLTAINLALSVAQELDRTVVLVDADLRKPSVHFYLGLDAPYGLSDYLTKKKPVSELFINPGIRKLTILPAGKPLANSSELLGGPKMETLVKEMKERYPERFVIFDSASLLSSADPLVLSQFVDGVLLVVESERTARRDLQRALELLKDRPIVGTLLNKARG